MGFSKPGAVAPQAEVKNTVVDSSLVAASARLKKAVVSESDAPAKSYGRDFDKEARGKTYCAIYVAVLGSPAAAGFKGIKDEASLRALAVNMATQGVKDVFGDPQ